MTYGLNKTFLSLVLLVIGVFAVTGCRNETKTPAPPAGGKAASSPVAGSAGSPAQAGTAADSQSPTHGVVTDQFASTGKLVVLKVPVPPDPTSPEILLVGDELNIFQEHGILLDFIGVIPAPQNVASVVSGRIDVSPGSHINRTIAGISAGAKILAVAGKTETTERVPHMIGIVSKDSPVKAPADLVGRKVGIPTIGGCNEYTPYAWLDKNGIADAKSKIEVIVMPEKNLEQVLRQGEIDLAMTHKLPEEINRQGEFTVVFSDYDVWAGDGGATPFYFSTDYIKEHPDVVRAFVAAIAETLNWSNDHPYEAREITARRTNQDVVNVSERYYTPNGIIKPETAIVWIDLLTAFGEIKPGLTAEQIYTNEFNPHYRPKL
ncbi:MAG: ABC transporter substrate-binding protein [Deltaproteobacteria bacterium]|jgi:ABC-type nitrate/sulfonate/bicarbonate transport system substrate-binding protein|nr:ABC transporter substrate-binding protein [Deltaproteobacteria bacterium]